MRALGIELGPEGVEAALLGAVIGGRGAGGGGFQRAMHALMPGILLRVAGLDELGVDAAPQEPHAELGQSSEGATGERRPIVRADSLGEPVVLKEAGEHRAHEGPRRLQEGLTAEQVAAEVVSDGEGIAVAAVAGVELALEVDRPERIRGDGNRAGPAGMGEGPPASPAAAEPAAREPQTGGAGGRPGRRRCPLPQQPEQLLRPPRRMALAGLGQLIDDATGRLPGRVMGPPRVRLEAGPALATVAGEDGVPGLPADAVAGTERGEGEDAELEVTDEE